MDIEYIPTGSFGNADVLSRLIQHHTKPEAEYVIASVELEEDLRDVQVATQADPLLRKVHKYVQDGWPHDDSFGAELARYHNRKESLSTVEGCVLFGERVVIPEKLRSRCLVQLHKGHPGMQRMKAIARSFLYWPMIDDDIMSYVASCGSCSAAAKAPPRATPAAWPTPTGTWRRVHVDYAGPWEGFYFLVVVDAFSKWPEIYKTSSTTTSATISMLRNIFARFGMPETLVSDNGPQFTSSLFEEFCNSNGIDHVTTAPFHPQSNGQAERFVDTLKRALRKIQSDETSLDEALELFLMAYRSTPNAQLSQQKTPAEEMFGRPIRTALELLRPPSSHSLSAPSSISVRRFQPGELVSTKSFHRNSWKWIPGKIVRSCGRVMYDVIADSGRLLRRHINQIRRRVAGSATQKHQIPLDVLLAEWPSFSRHEPTQPASETGRCESSAPPPSSFALTSLAPSAPTDVPVTTSQSLHPPELSNRYKASDV
ncbi:uncharacterized protein K02A2.6-like [Anopheles stephensi]|uniref:uncharacterized protein K02A2.6-like n=1 Tax=Anopheles stephensi TaxID=30069 RepID=UPI001658AEA4|nr:uncharacterized protein K02A2.6-like [Anopheles stephensi]